MTKLLLTLCAMALASVSVFAQTGTLKGTINTSDNKAAAYVNVYLKGTNKGTSTDKNGNYTLRNLSPGDYVLVASYVGLKKKELEVSVSPNEITQIPVLLLEIDSEELNEVVIQGDRATNKFAEPESEFVAKMPLENIENPQVYNTIDSRLLKEQVITNFNDALKNAPGITRVWESTGRGGDGAGYYSMRGFTVQPTMMNGLPALTNGALDPVNMEKIEVIKGPSGTLFGSSLISYGGLINVVTKRPYEEFGGEINYITGSYGLNRITADINTPLNDDKSVLLRVNTAYHTENSFQDAGYKKSFYIAPSLTYKANDKLTFLINAEILNAEAANAPMIFLTRSEPLRLHSIDDFKALGYNNERSFTSNDLTMKTPSFSLQGQAIYKISEKWTSQTAVSSSSAKSQGYYSYLISLDATDTTNADLMTLGLGGEFFSRKISRQNSTTLGTDIQQNFIGDFEIGSLRNRLVAGVDFFHRELINNSTGYLQNGTIYFGTESVAEVNETLYGITNPRFYRTNYDDGILSQPGANAALAGSGVSNSQTQQQVLSAYVSDVLNITPNLTAMASLRVDRFMDKDDSDNDQTTLSPKFGLVYQLIPNQLSVFGNYMDGFKNTTPKVQGDQTIENFDPEHANQWEVGAKINMFNERLSATVSYYDIQVSDIIRTDPERANFSIQDGESYSEGIEVSIIANPIQGLNIVTGYSYNEAETKNTSPQTDGRRSPDAGPKSLFNFWASYSLNQGSLQGLGAGVGANYASEYATTNTLVTGKFTLPSYTIFNASLFYNTDKYRLALKLDNLTNEEYYTGWTTISPQKTRSLSASFAYRF
ncbi:TonB-dependent receptor [Fulvivirga sediminis]|uniref:TonB-dependent receptor n=1 Tax=Fulvivirga sediminis TaxID=2803949 RepID=A0A937K171_9BACT|nr:TonB-dependent receptor [Fulvivirga sediminis]MBL3658314.1 TonB-dependent receptor [Fulvivirga sediminis]